MVNFGYPYNDLVICKDSTDYLCHGIDCFPSDILALISASNGWAMPYNASVSANIHRMCVIQTLYYTYDTHLCVCVR